MKTRIVRDTLIAIVLPNGTFSTTHLNLKHQIDTTTPEARREFCVDLYSHDVQLDPSFWAEAAQPVVDIVFADMHRAPEFDSYDRGFGRL